MSHSFLAHCCKLLTPFSILLCCLTMKSWQLWTKPVKHKCTNEPAKCHEHIVIIWHSCDDVTRKFSFKGIAFTVLTWTCDPSELPPPCCAPPATSTWQTCPANTHNTCPKSVTTKPRMNPKAKHQALAYSILSPTTAVTDCTTGLGKLSANKVFCWYSNGSKFVTDKSE